MSPAVELIRSVKDEGECKFPSGFGAKNSNLTARRSVDGWVLEAREARLGTVTDTLCLAPLGAVTGRVATPTWDSSRLETFHQAELASVLHMTSQGVCSERLRLPMRGIASLRFAMTTSRSRLSGSFALQRE